MKKARNIIQKMQICAIPDFMLVKIRLIASAIMPPVPAFITKWNLMRYPISAIPMIQRFAEKRSKSARSWMLLRFAACISNM